MSRQSISQLFLSFSQNIPSNRNIYNRKWYLTLIVFNQEQPAVIQADRNALVDPNLIKLTRTDAEFFISNPSQTIESWWTGWNEPSGSWW